MVREKLKTPEGRKFLLALLVVFMIAAACVGRATIVGVIEQYNIPLSAWTTSMFVLQSASSGRPAGKQNAGRLGL